MEDGLSNALSAPPGRERDEIGRAVVTAVAEEEGVSPVALQPPLASVIDPEALQQLVASMISRPGVPRATVEFEYNGYLVTVTEVGTVTVTELETSAIETGPDGN